jgi:Uroporphyrinogen decarboxylase (URO-D)
MIVEERITAALRGDIPDKVPSFVPQILPELRTKISEVISNSNNTGQLQEIKTNNFDFTYHVLFGFQSGFSGGDSALLPNYKEEDFIVKKFSDGSFLDFYGRIMKVEEYNGTTNAWYIDGTIKNEADWRKWDHLKPLKLTDKYFNELKQIFQRGKEVNFYPIPLVQGLFAKTTEMMTLARFSYHNRKNPDLLEEILDRMLECKLDVIQQYNKHQIKVVAVADDIAFKDNLMLSPASYNKYFVPRLKKLTDFIHECGMLTFMHSDGDITPLIPSIIEAGFDGIQCLEAAAGINIFQIKKQYGTQITLIGNLDVSHLLSFGTPQQVAEQTKILLERLKPGGRYIFSPCADLFEEISFENLSVIKPVFQEYGNY